MKLDFQPLTARRWDDLGAKPVFDRAGFAEVAWRRPTRPVMRKPGDDNAPRARRARRSLPKLT